MTTDELAQIEIEMRAAFKRRKETREALTAARGELEDRKADHKTACEAVDALVLQLGTGQRQATMPGFSEPGSYGYAEPPGEPDADLTNGKAAWDSGTVDRAARADARMAAAMKHAMEEDVPENWRAEAPANGNGEPRKARKTRKEAAK